MYFPGFGYGVGDIITVTQLGWKAVQNTRQACGQYDELTREATSLHIVLNRLRDEAEKPESLLLQLLEHEKPQLDHIINGCGEVVRLLNEILEKYGAIGEEKRSVTKLWQRVRFGKGEMQDLSQIRMQLSSQTSSLALFLHLLALGSQSRVERQLAQQMDALQEIQQSMDHATTAVALGGNRESSILSTYDNGFWKELWRDLIVEGCSSDVMVRHRDTVMAYIMELGLEGNFGVEDGLESQPSQSLNELATEGSSTAAFDFDNEVVKSRIYTRVMARESVRNSIGYFPAHLAPAVGSQDWPLISTSQHQETVDSSSIDLRLTNNILGFKTTEIPQRQLELMPKENSPAALTPPTSADKSPPSQNMGVISIIPSQPKASLPSPRRAWASKERKNSGTKKRVEENPPILDKTVHPKGPREYKLLVIGGGGGYKNSRFAILVSAV